MTTMNLRLTGSICGLAFFAGSTFAADEGKVYINPALGKHIFDGARGLDDATSTSVGAEYVLTPKLGVEASYLSSNPDFTIGNLELDVDQYTLDALYYLKPFREWQPYLKTGLGHGKFDSAKETQLDVGLGSRYSFNENWSARIQAKLIHSLDGETWDSLMTIGLSYAFGGQSKPTPKPMLLLDSDGDGIYDDDDSCMNTLPNVAVDSRGCALDSDGDGVFDTNDICKNTLPNMAVDSRGCALDSDGDGIPDTNDLCMETPKDITVGSTGCALDSDEDGMVDYLDDCPHSTLGAVVDNNGCEIVVMKTETIKLAINFANNSAVVPESAMTEVKAVADFMLRNVATTVVIEGHTDDRGNPDYNKDLSQRRADAVMQLLIDNYDVASQRVKAVGYGKDQPIADNATAAGRSENRRVVAEITHTGAK